MNSLLESAIKLRSQKRFEEAKAILLELAETGSDPGIFFHCACTHDAMGLEREAIPFYIRAISHGLKGEDLRCAYIGLGSSYRCIGDYENALSTLTEGLSLFPNDDVISAFLAMAAYNSGNYKCAVQLLLDVMVKLPSVGNYGSAISFYRDNLDTTW